MKLSILVISRSYELLNRMLKSLVSSTKINKSKIETLCSWNGPDKDLEMISFQEELNLKIFKVKPYNFASNMNRLINRSKGEYILLINDDVILDKKSLDFGLQLLENNKQIGLVGGKLRDSKGNLSHAGVNFSFFNSPYHFLEGIVKTNSQLLLNNDFCIPASTGALMLTKKNVLEKVKFNEKYHVCAEDIELCLDIRQFLKKEIWFCHQFSGIHEAETTKIKFNAQRKNIYDNKRIISRYSNFINNSNGSEIYFEYHFNLKILRYIFKYKLKSWQRRFHTDFWAFIVLKLIIIKFKIILMRFNRN